jgi:hypothetical protein
MVPEHRTAFGSWWDEVCDWPFLHFFALLFQATPDYTAAPLSQAVAADEIQRVSDCSIAPLDPIQDPETQRLEASVGSEGVVDVSKMIPAASQALDRFESSVAAVGGTIVLKSAYRPMSYQKHLQNVWYKWMYELRDNTDPACQDLRTQLQDEFTRHHLIETQHPVAISDHTRGLAFDATVDLPGHTRLGRRRVTLDTLAHLAGLVRPAIESDPVHFKYVGRELAWHNRHMRNG